MALMRTKIEKDTRLSELTKKKQDIVEKMGKANLAKVTIEKVIYPGNVIVINGVRAVVTEEEHHVEYARRGQDVCVMKRHYKSLSKKKQMVSMQYIKRLSQVAADNS